MRTLLIAVSALALSAGAGHAAFPNFNQLDGNQDSQLSKQEFNAAFKETPVLANWDGNKDQVLDANEFHTGIFDIWDTDEDGKLSEQEVNHGISVWLDPKPADATFANLDADKNGTVTRQELQNGMPPASSLFAAWDQNSDGKLGIDEIQAGLFEVWDTNNDDMVAEAEFNAQIGNADWLN